jgi:hypothetical protein
VASINPSRRNEPAARLSSIPDSGIRPKKEACRMPWHLKPLLGPMLGLLLTTASASQANTVACHLTYGGETRTIEAAPTTSPYSEVPIAIGSRLLFRLVNQAQAADLAAIKLYTYVDRDEGPVLIHQTSYPLPPRTNDRYGFTGLHFVYEPVRDGELQYWCELKDRP